MQSILAGGARPKHGTVTVQTVTKTWSYPAKDNRYPDEEFSFPARNLNETDGATGGLTYPDLNELQELETADLDPDQYGVGSEEFADSATEGGSELQDNITEEEENIGVPLEELTPGTDGHSNQATAAITSQDNADVKIPFNQPVVMR